ncbi:MAG: hypothetical protein ACI825_000980 [Planctomycetota bacterium]|jgi:hypothetical protein|uniref:hypothetical protein n=1 Tax=Patiriisocius sp. Uisw_047 TaxID=3230969 RepID=UPI0039E8F4E0
MQLLHFQLIIFSLLVFSSCENDKNKTLEATQEIQQAEVVFGKNNHNTPLENPAVAVITAQWGAYIDFADDIPKVNRSTIDKLRVLSSRLVVSSDSLYRFIPDTLNTRPISARLLVLQTRIKLLHQALGFDRLDSIRVEEHILEINDAHSNFITQMNEKFIKDGINQEQKDVEDREIEKRKRDSIFKAELRDNNKN